jgi:hypothetical protein
VSLHKPVRAVCRLLVTLMLALTAGATAAAFSPASAFASTYDFEAQFVAKMNAARQSSGLAPYSVASDLVSIARNHSAQMASQQSLYHNPSLTSQVQNWQAVGENVGEGPTVSDIHNAFMQSPEHRANILDHDFTQVGVGVSVDKNGMIWVTEDFREPAGGGTATTTHQSAPATHSSSGSSAPAAAAPVSTGTTSAAPAPQPAVSPRAVLLHRLHDLRVSHAHHATGDPVSQAFAYVNTLATLAR